VTSDHRTAADPGRLLQAAADKVRDDLWLPTDLAHLRDPLVLWLLDERQALEDNPGRYSGAALDMARAILDGR
jgi:hypothetical protein